MGMQRRTRTISKGKCVLCFLLALVFVTCVALLLFYDYHWQDFGVDAGVNDSALQASRITTVQEQPVILAKYEAIHKKYKDAAGFIQIKNTGVQYYVFQSGDDEYYLSHNRDGKKSGSGEIFVDFRCNIQTLSRHMIVYGHNMRNNSMFGSLDKFKKQSFCEANPVIDFDTLYGSYRWQIFSVQIVNVDQTGNTIIKTQFDSDEEWYRYILDCQKQSIYPIPVELKKDDIVLTLMTCSYEYKDGRLLIRARLMR